MSTSGVTTYNVTRDQIINGALRIIGAIAQGESPTATQTTEAAEALNLMVKAWEADGNQLWGMTEYSMSLTADTATYNIGVGQTINIPRPVRVIRAHNHTISTGVDVPMRLLTREQYNALGNKTTSGNPIQFYYDPQVAYGVLKLFPVPDATLAASQQIILVYQRPFEDFVNSGDNPDFPQEWMEALKYGLAVRLASEYGLSLEQRQILRKEAEEVKTLALQNGIEEGSTYFQVDRRSW